MNSRFPQTLTETALVQNPALGAFALWKFGLAYQARVDEDVTLPLLFLVLPLVLHSPTLEVIVGTNKPSGLALFAGKLGEKQEDLFAVHERTRLLKLLTLESIILGEQSGLFSLNINHATIRANALIEGVRMPTLPERIKWLTPCCEKLGHWFAGLTDQQVARMLKVEF